MSRVLICPSGRVLWTYNKARHRIDARVLHDGKLFSIHGRNLGEIKNRLSALTGQGGIYTLAAAREA